MISKKYRSTKVEIKPFHNFCNDLYCITAPLNISTQLIGYLITFFFFTRTSKLHLRMAFLILRGGSRTAATSKVELFVIIVNGFQPLTIITKSSTLDVAAVLYPPLNSLRLSVHKILMKYPHVNIKCQDL